MTNWNFWVAGLVTGTSAWHIVLSGPLSEQGLLGIGICAAINVAVVLGSRSKDDGNQ